MRVAIACVLLTSLAHADLNAQHIRKVVKKHIRDIGSCFETHGDVNARVQMAFTITKRGETMAVSASGEGNRDLHGCLVGVFKRMQFPASSSATKVTYPVHIIVAGQ